MIAALYSSKNSRTKAFQYEGVCFGWSVIEDLFARELRRINDRQPRQVPGLHESCLQRHMDKIECEASQDHAGNYNKPACKHLHIKSCNLILGNKLATVHASLHGNYIFLCSNGM